MQRKKGISLIVLVITIIVMIVLAGAIILSLNNSNIFERAKYAVGTSNQKQVEQMASLAWSEAYLEGARTQVELKAGVVEKLGANGITEEDYILLVSTNGVQVIDAKSYDHAYTCTNGVWSTRIENGNQLNGDIVARFYKTGNKMTVAEEVMQMFAENGVNVSEEQEEYKLVITGAGKVGTVVDYNVETEEEILNAWASEQIELVSGMRNESVFTSTTELVLAAELENQAGLYLGSFLSLGNAIIADGVTTIGESLFVNCYSLTSVTILSSVKSIGAYAFDACDSLENIEIPSSVANIGEGAFRGCVALKTIMLPNHITSIANYTFDACIALNDVVIPSTVSSIGFGAFNECEGLTNITIPDTITSVVERAFVGCNNLTTVNYTGSAEQWNLITVGSGNEPLINATKNYNYVIK